MNNTIFKNITFTNRNGILLFKEESTISNSNGICSFDNVLVEKITQKNNLTTQDESIQNLFHFTNFGDIFIQNSNFYTNTIAKNLFFIDHLKSAFFRNCSFFENIVKNQIIYASNLFSHEINDTKCVATNMNAPKNNELLGGCFKGLNIVNRIYHNLTISMCFSNFTTIGIKVIDEASKTSNTMIISCIFKNNYVNFQNDEFETAVAIYLSSGTIIKIINSTFMVNFYY